WLAAAAVAVVGHGRYAQHPRQRPRALVAARRAVVRAGLAGGHGLRIRTAAGIAALAALGLRQQAVETFDQWRKRSGHARGMRRAGHYRRCAGCAHAPARAILAAAWTRRMRCAWKRCWCWRSGPRPPRRRRPWRPDTRRTRCRCRTSPRRRFRASPMTPRAGSDRCWPRPCRARRTSPVTKCWCNGVAVPTACGCWPPTAAVEGWCRCPVRPAAGTEPAKCWTTGPTAACWSLEESSKASPATAGITSCSRAAVSYGCISSRWRRPARWPTDSGAGAPAAPPAFVGEGEHGAVLPAVAVGMDALVAGQVVAGEDVGDLVPPAVAAGVAAGE